MTTEFVCNLANGVCPFNCRLTTDVPQNNMDKVMIEGEEYELVMDRSFANRTIMCYRCHDFTASPYWVELK